MRHPSIPEAILELLLADAIKSTDAQQYLNNYECFEQEKSTIETSYDGRWIASINNQIYAADSLEDLQQVIQSVPDSNRAYIEHVGRII